MTSAVQSMIIAPVLIGCSFLQYEYSITSSSSSDVMSSSFVNSFVFTCVWELVFVNLHSVLH